MPWKETDMMNEHHLLIADYLSDEYTIAELSRLYEVSRKTVYKWVSRYRESGFEGLSDRSRRPHHIPHRCDSTRLDILVDVKARHPTWGPRKIVAYLEARQADRVWPAPSTVGGWFKRLGLVNERKRRRRVAPYSEPFRDCADCNSVWSADFKGQFKTGDGIYCYPLTLSDNFSRYLLACRGLYRPDYDGCRRWFEWAFRTYGLPEAIRTDNGAPFAGRGKGGLSRLAVWWIKLGIVPERIGKGKPQQNGRHERMHRTLKAETTRPVGRDLADQQIRFERFVKEYNEIRPHESLSNQVPGQVYQASEQAYPRRFQAIDYDSDWLVRSVRHSGEIRFRGGYITVSELLKGERVGLKPISDGIYEVYFSFHRLGYLDVRTGKIEETYKTNMVNCNPCTRSEV